MVDIYIPQRFKKQIALHIAKNLLTENDNVPLILGIHGPSGFGKTFQCEHVLREMGVKAFLLSGGQLESHRAGEPAQMIRNLYLRASKEIDEKKCRYAVILINDIDTGVGNWGELVQYTTNRQMVFGELMHLVDYPNRVENIPTNRIPIILTGNDFTRLHEPLVRAGRMTSFEWIPETEEMIKIISRIFKFLSDEECSKLFFTLREKQKETKNTYPLSIAFFSHLYGTLLDDKLWTKIQDIGGITNVVSYLSVSDPPLDLTMKYEKVATAGCDLLVSGKLTNHLH